MRRREGEGKGELERERERFTISSRNEPHRQPSLPDFPYKPGSAACPSIGHLLKEPLDSYTQFDICQSKCLSHLLLRNRRHTLLKCLSPSLPAPDPSLEDCRPLLIAHRKQKEGYSCKATSRCPLGDKRTRPVPSQKLTTVSCRECSAVYPSLLPALRGARATSSSEKDIPQHLANTHWWSLRK